MKQFKYYFNSDLNKESVGRVKAKDIHNARQKAAIKKNLSLTRFVKLFNVEEI